MKKARGRHAKPPKTASVNVEPAIHLRLLQRPPGPLERSTGVAPVVPGTLTSSGAKRGFFTRQDFIYNAEHDHYTLPGGRETRRGQPPGGSTEEVDFCRPWGPHRLTLPASDVVVLKMVRVYCRSKVEPVHYAVPI